MAQVKPDGCLVYWRRFTLCGGGRDGLRRGASSEAGDMRCVGFFFFESRRRHTIFDCDWSSDVCSSDLTATAKDNLLREGVHPRHIQVTGNTVIDALFFALDRIRKVPPIIPGLPEHFQPRQSNGTGRLAERNSASRRLALITGHRREESGRGI